MLNLEFAANIRFNIEMAKKKSIFFFTPYYIIYMGIFYIIFKINLF